MRSTELCVSRWFMYSARHYHLYKANTVEHELSENQTAHRQYVIIDLMNV